MFSISGRAQKDLSLCRIARYVSAAVYYVRSSPLHWRIVIRADVRLMLDIDEIRWPLAGVKVMRAAR